jgi:hypothetical protein
MCQSCLDDDRNAALHGRERFRNGRVRHVDPVDANEVEACLRQMLDIALLVGGAALP